MHLDYFKKEHPVILALLLRQKIIDPTEYASRVVDWSKYTKYVRVRGPSGVVTSSSCKTVQRDAPSCSTTCDSYTNARLIALSKLFVNYLYKPKRKRCGGWWRRWFILADWPIRRWLDSLRWRSIFIQRLFLILLCARRIIEVHSLLSVCNWILHDFSSVT